MPHSMHSWISHVGAALQLSSALPQHLSHRLAQLLHPKLVELIGNAQTLNHDGSGPQLVSFLTSVH